MIRKTRTALFAVATTAAAVIAIPGGGASAEPIYPTAIVSTTSRGPQVTSVTCQRGENLTLWGDSSINPAGTGLRYSWFSDVDSIGGFESSYVVPCDFSGSIVVTFRATAVGEPDEYWEHDTSEVLVTANEPPTGSFTPAPAPNDKRTVVAVGTKITFKPVASSDASDWAWRTTGVSGVASRDYSFTRTFDQIGNYGVQLTETNQGGSATRWAGYTVIGRPTVSVTPAPAIETERTKVPVGTKITFDGSGSRSPGGGSLTYQWRTTGRSGVAADGRTYTRTFDSVGNFAVELTVVNELGQSTKRWVGFEVVPAADPVASVTSKPAGSPDATKRTPVKVGTTITFDGRASVDPDGGQLTYQWRTTGSNGAAVTDTYTRKFDKVGDVGVALTVIDDEGRTATRWVGFTVQP